MYIRQLIFKSHGLQCWNTFLQPHMYDVVGFKKGKRTLPDPITVTRYSHGVLVMIMITMIWRPYDLCNRGFNDYWTLWICIYKELTRYIFMNNSVHYKFMLSSVVIWPALQSGVDKNYHCMVFRQIIHLDFFVTIRPCLRINSWVMLTCWDY